MWLLSSPTAARIGYAAGGSAGSPPPPGRERDRGVVGDGGRARRRSSVRRGLGLLGLRGAVEGVAEAAGPLADGRVERGADVGLEGRPPRERDGLGERDVRREADGGARDGRSGPGLCANKIFNSTSM